jgi:low affinity Fe/Cu permease
MEATVIDGIRHLLTRLGVFTAHPAAFAVAGLYAALWYGFQPETLNWPGVATLATLFMTLLIQRAEHRDTQAIHAKLDELLNADRVARNSLKKVDQKEPEEIEQLRKTDQH